MKTIAIRPATRGMPAVSIAVPANYYRVTRGLTRTGDLLFCMACFWVGAVPGQPVNRTTIRPRK